MTDRRLNAHDNDEDMELPKDVRFIIPGEKTEEKEIEKPERKSPITEGVTEVTYVTWEEREKQLRDEYRKKLEEEKKKNLTPGMNR